MLALMRLPQLLRFGLRGKRARGRDLSLLLKNADPSAHWEAKLLWLEALVGWILEGTQEGAHKGARDVQLLRLHHVLHALQESSARKLRVARTLRSILEESRGLNLFAYVGLPSSRGLLTEVADRAAKKLLPQPPRDRDLSELLSRLFRTQSDLEWVESLPRQVVGEIQELIEYGCEPEEDPWISLREDMRQSLIVLVSHARSLGLSREIREKGRAGSLTDHPFYELSCAIDALVAKSEYGVSESTVALSELAFAAQRKSQACRRRTEEALSKLEDAGVSLSIVYRLQSIVGFLERIETIIEVMLKGGEPRVIPLRPGLPASTALLAQPMALEFTHELIRASVTGRKVSAPLTDGVSLLSKKIIEHASRYGESYKVSSWAEYRHMFLAGGGGGALTALTTAIKYMTLAAAFAPFFDTSFIALNYAASFIVMQLLGFKLATKLSAMTATHLAVNLERSGERPEEFVGEVAKICRSQFIAVLGNVLFVIPFAILFHFLYVGIFGEQFLPAETANHLMHSLDPFQTLTIFYAVLTGFCLWFSTVAAGWLENWSNFRRLPLALAESRGLKAAFGAQGAQRISKVFSAQIGGFGASVSLGVLLAVVPAFGKFTGLPFDVRHVTLSSGALALSVCATGFQGQGMLIARAALGISIIAILNFGVSFALALWVAMRARGVKTRRCVPLLTAAFLEFAKYPFRFLFPVGDPTLEDPVQCKGLYVNAQARRVEESEAALSGLSDLHL